jgi:uncharacterized protein YxjI
MREKMLAIGDDFWIEDADGQKVFKVDGKAMRMRDTFVLEDAQGNELAKIQERKLSVRDKMNIDIGNRSATVKKAMIGIRERYSVDDEYEIEADGDTIARVSKKWFRMRDTYGVEVEASADAVLVLAVTVAVDSMSHDHV